MRVKSLHIYPLKSGQGHDLGTVKARPRGLGGDRRYMLVDAKGEFVTQRQMPKLAQLSVRITSDGLVLSAPDLAQISIPTPSRGPRAQVNVWRSRVNAALASAAVNERLSDWLGMPVSLVHMDAVSQREANPKWTNTPHQVSFADGYPVLITNTASLDALNAHIRDNGHDPVSMNRFRPNIVIESEQAWGEDTWGALKIGSAVFDLVKPCARCIMTTLDQHTGQKQNREPLQSLRALRTSTDPRNAGVIFGMNSVVRVCGNLSVGDSAERV